MQNSLNPKSADEIDLRELFTILWVNKFLIAITCAIGICYAGYYALNTDKEFTSTAIFKFDEKSNAGFNLNQMGIMSNLAALTNFSNRNLPKDLINGRIFIEKLDTELNFQADPYFNTYNPNSSDPIWKSFIKRAIGWQKSSPDINEAIWQGIVSAYSKSVVLDSTKDGSVKVIVTHVDSQRAAKIANVIMNKIISNNNDKRNMVQDEQVAYMSNTLAKALNDLEVSQSKLKTFAVKNSALPIENFTEESLKLDALRDQLNQTSELHEAVAALSLLLQNKTTDQDDYLVLRQKFPLVDQVEFRRILGQSEITNSWNWPKANSVDAVFNTLSERKNRLTVQINASEIDAERLGAAVDAYAKLKRAAEVSEATYTVLIEQVKAQSIVAGYRPNSTEIYEYATATINPSAPNRNLILALGATLGLCLGAALSVILALNRGVFYSKNSLINGAQPQLTASIRSLLHLRNKSLKDLNSILARKPRSTFIELATRIHKNAITQVVVTSSRAKMTSNDLARALSIYMQSDTLKVAVIDFSSKAKKQNIDDETLLIESFVVDESEGHLSVLRPQGSLGPMEMLSQRDFWKNIQSLNSTFDLIFLCADDRNAISLLNALQNQKTLHITLVRTKKTKSSTLTQMRSLLPIEGLLHE